MHSEGGHSYFPKGEKKHTSFAGKRKQCSWLHSAAALCYLAVIVWENFGSLQSPGSSFHIGEIKDITLVIKNVSFP